MTTFNELFYLRFGLSSETKILEMCGWDEDRAADVTEAFSSAIQSAIDECSNLSRDDMIDSVKNIMLEQVNDEEVEVLIEILEESIQNSNFIISADEQYEN
tara:strand:+ start:1252 stop:1554 length:303 start_codon:yes stop_codon:yes gene_type:complete